VRRRRRSARLTQEQLAERAGLSARTIRDLERDRVRYPRPTSVRLIADALGLAGEERDGFTAAAREGFWADQDAAPVSRAAPSPGGPVQLPPDTAGFSGRTAELAALDEAFAVSASAGTPTLLLVTGMAGVGKSALAVRWAAGVRTAFPGGQLFVSMRGSGSAPLPPTAVAERLLRGLGLPGTRIPEELDDRAALLRSELVHRPALLVLDDALDSEQVRPLLPAGGGCATVVTSRRRLDGLVARDGARLVELDVPTHDEAELLLDLAVGDGRTRAEPIATASLVRLCGRLPLALRIAAARLVVHRPDAVHELVDELAEEQERLSRLAVEDGDTAVRTAFTPSYRALPPGAPRLFRLLGAQPLASLSRPAVVALAGTDPTAARRDLDVLESAHLVERDEEGRCAMHDLIRLYAGEQSHADGIPGESALAVHRLLDWYVRVAEAGERTLSPYIPMRILQVTHEPVEPVGFANQMAALAWYDGEAPHLLDAAAYAADHGHPAVSWQLADYQHTWGERHGVLPHWLDAYKIGLAAAVGAGDERAHASMVHGIGIALATRRRPAEALEWLQRAADLNERLGNRNGEAVAAMNVGTACMELGRWEDGAAQLNRALEVFRADGQRQRQGACLGNLGWAYRQIGEWAKAREHLLEALAFAVEAGDQYVEANVNEDLGAVAAGLGDHADALDRYRRAVEVAREAGIRQVEAWALRGIGDVHLQLGQPDAAREGWAAALDILVALDSPEADQVRARLAGLPASPG
jgi:tetratricopeptide (TPR) repeat protein/DNA-binding XRE family transcriptional regulator